MALLKILSVDVTQSLARLERFKTDHKATCGTKRLDVSLDCTRRTIRATLTCHVCSKTATRVFNIADWSVLARQP